MLTIDKIRVYEKYGGDYDHYSVYSETKPGFIVDGVEWMLIKDLAHEMFIVQSGLASAEFKERLRIRLIENCDNEHTIEYLKGVRNY